MGKRNGLVVLSSDDEDSNLLCIPKHSFSKRKSSSTVPRRNPQRAKKPRLSGSQPRLHADEFTLFSEDFDQVFSGFKVSSGGISSFKQPWVDKYKPSLFEELAVHKKKIEEVKIWFEERLRNPKDNFSNHALVISGPAGAGKSASIRVIASHLGARLYEWDTPTPVIWQEHLHNSSAGVQYTSKLDEFENFVERIRKYGVVPASFNEESKPSIILLIDDLPSTNGKVALRRLQNCLRLLVQSTQVPTAILITDCAKSESTDLTVRCLEELRFCLENAGACKVSFNSITNNTIKKTLSRICRQEQCNLTVEQIDMIAKASGGDIRQAITSLQFFCLKPTSQRSLSVSSPHPAYLKDNADEPNAFSFNFGRDETLSLFHALGKFLHNKRETESSMVLYEDAFLIQERLSRLPLKMDAPEKVLCQAHGQARPITDFLHENVLDFLNEEAIDDAWTVASYLGDADSLLATSNCMLARYNDVENVLQSAAASVAVRGVLFGNFHPLPSRWHAIRRPKLWQIEESSVCNKNEMLNQRFTAYGGLSSSDVSFIATEYIPVLKCLGDGKSRDHGTPLTLKRNSETEIEYFGKLNLENQESSISEDEIEEW